jgi:hypothetical protein
MPSSSRLTRFAVVTAAGLTVLTHPTAAQQGDRSWKPTARVQADVRYDDNPFLLTPVQKGRLQTGSAADALSGRFRDMTSFTDAIPVAGVEVGLTGPGLFGRALDVSAEAAYEANAQNARRRHAELTFGIQQSFPKAGRLRLRADWRPSYFWKNYLSDAIDLSGDGNISADERVYRPATSHEVDLTLNYRQRLVKSRRSRRTRASCPSGSRRSTGWWTARSTGGRSWAGWGSQGAGPCCCTRRPARSTTPWRPSAKR